MTMTVPNICIVGAGRLASRRIYPYIVPAGGRLVGVCDLIPEIAEEKTRLYGGQAFTDMEEMLTALKPDGVIICTGPVGHAALAPKALRKGIPVYTEKPAAPSAAEAYELVKVSRETGVRCMTGFKKRYAKAYRRAVEWMAGFPEEQRLSISVDYASGAYPDKDGPRSHLLDFAIHQIDLIGHLFGDVEKVACFTKDHRAYAVSLKFVSGAVGALNFTDGRSFQVPTEEVEITLAGGNFMTIHNSSCWRITENETPKEWREPVTFVSSGDSGEDTGHLTELREFMALIGDPGRDIPSDIYASYKSIVLYDAILSASVSGDIVEVKYDH